MSVTMGQYQFNLSETHGNFSLRFRKCSADDNIPCSFSTLLCPLGSIIYVLTSQLADRCFGTSLGKFLGESALAKTIKFVLVFFQDSFAWFGVANFLGLPVTLRYVILIEMSLIPINISLLISAYLLAPYVDKAIQAYQNWEKFA